MTKKLTKVTKPTKKLEPLDLFLSNFAGELITVIVNKDITQTKQTEEYIESLTSSLSVEGYLTDLDDTFVYLGYMPEQIHQAINRDFIIHVELKDEGAFEEIMAQEEKPGSTYN